MCILVTGAAGFIGFHLCKELIKLKQNVIGIDNFNSYYDPELKRSRIEILKKASIKNKVKFSIFKIDINDKNDLQQIFIGKDVEGKKYDNDLPNKVVHLAAQAGVRYSIENPEIYIKTNLVGFGNIIDLAKEYKIQHFLYASSSSVYGGNINLPFKEKYCVDHPVSLYGATKKANELIAHSYSHLYKLPTTGLRFFTVYGPYGRPDMALFLFTKAILEEKPIDIFNYGEMIRDFTYIDDIIRSLIKLINQPPFSNNNFDKENPNPSSSWAPYKIFNIGNSQPINLMEYIEEIEKATGKKAIKNFLPMQPGDVKSTASDTTLLEEWIDFKPITSIKKGISEFVDWYKDYYKLKVN